MNELFLSSWRMIDGSDEKDEVRCGRSSQMEGCTASIEGPAVRAGSESGNSMLDLRGEGTRELREALPKVGYAGQELEINPRDILSTKVSKVMTSLQALGLQEE